MIDEAIDKVMKTDNIDDYTPNEWIPFDQKLFSSSSGNGHVVRDLTGSLLLSVGQKGMKLVDPIPFKSIDDQ